jgi:hypothetical protein
VQSAFKEQLNKHYFTDGQKILFDYKGFTLVAKVSDIEVVGLDGISLFFFLLLIIGKKLLLVLKQLLNYLMKEEDCLFQIQLFY